MNKKRLIIIFLLALLTSIIIFLLFRRNVYIEIDNFSNKVNVNSTFNVPKAKGYYCKTIFSKKCIEISKYIKVENNDVPPIKKYTVNFYDQNSHVVFHKLLIF